MKTQGLPAKIIFLLFLSNMYSNAQSTELKVSAYTFSVQPKVGTPSGHSRSGNQIEEVHGDLKSTLVLFQQGETKMCLLTSSFGVEWDLLHEICVEKLSRALNIPDEAVVTNSSHNHTLPFMIVDEEEEKPADGTPDLLSWELGKEFLKGLEKAADHVSDNLTPVTVEWGKAEENRITYNRKGYRPDGSSYFMREEDRLNIEGEGYIGLIDPEAIVVVFQSYAHKPVAALSFFTGHPVAAYSPEKLISYGQFPQAGSEILSKHLGNIPVAFVQGTAGDINSKYLLTDKIAEAKELGEFLGESFIVAANSLRPSKRVGFEMSREAVNVPLSKLPGQEKLQKDLNSIDDFIKRGKEGDENTMECVGMNFPKALTPPYRARLVDLVRPWYVWALDQYKTQNLDNVPEYLPMEIVVARFGDVGFVGMPFETFVSTGLKIKEEAIFPCVLTCGYTDGRYGYIPD